MGLFSGKEKKVRDHEPQPQVKTTKPLRKWFGRRDTTPKAKPSLSITEVADPEENKKQPDDTQKSDETPPKPDEGTHTPRASSPDGKRTASLWDRAYDSLKEKESTLITEYEELLCKEFPSDITAPGCSHTSPPIKEELTAP